jgi:hypothetical protein
MSVNALFLLIGGIIFLGIAGSYLFEKRGFPMSLFLWDWGLFWGRLWGWSIR